MSTQSVVSTPINDYVAGLLSDAAYTPAGTIALTAPIAGVSLSSLGWLDITTEVGAKVQPPMDYFGTQTDSDGIPTNEFRVFFNPYAHQIVFAFKGSSNASNGLSDLNLGSEGYDAYTQIEAAAQAYYDEIRNDPAYAGYTIYADGHSLGGGMAQCFAVQNDLNGYGQNSLPIPQAFINDYIANDYSQTGQSFDVDLATVRGNRTFHEVNVGGDIATLLYSSVLHDKYIDDGSSPNLTPKTLASPYTAAEAVGDVFLASPAGPVANLIGLAAVVGPGAVAHKIGTYETLVQRQSSDAGTTLTDAQAKSIANAFNAVTSGTMNPDKSVTLTASGSSLTVVVPPPINTTASVSQPSVSEANAIAIAGPDNSTLTETTGNVVLISGKGNDTLVAGKGDDTLVGGFGNTTMVGGEGKNVYLNMISPTAGSVTDTIEDATGTGSVYVADPTGGTTTQLTGTTNAGTNFTWTGSDGTRYQFSPNDPASPLGIGTLVIAQGVLGDQERIVVDGFDLSKAEGKDGYLGIHLGTPGVALIAGGARSNDSYAAGNFAGNAGAAAASGDAQKITAYVSEVSDQPQTITLVIVGGDASSFVIDTGDGRGPVSFSGSVTLTVPPGQDSVSFDLLNIGDTSSAETVQLTATLNGSDNSTPGTLQLSYAAGQFQNPVTNSTISGLAETKSNGTPYTLYEGDDGNNLIVTDNGPNWINGGGGNDSIVAGSGNDTIYGASGNKVIVGGGGQDLIQVGDGNNEIYVNSQVDLGTAITQAQSGTSSTDLVSVVIAGNGDNTIVGGNTANIASIGDGNNLVILGSGPTWLACGVSGFTTPTSNWSLNIDTDPAEEGIWSSSGVTHDPTDSTYDYSPSYEGVFISGVSVPVGVGNNTIIAGAGASVIYLSNGNNDVELGSGFSLIQGGMGDNTVVGGSGDFLFNGGGGNDYVTGGSGNDCIVGRGGNNVIIGGSGNDTIYAGDKNYYGVSQTPNDTIWASGETGNNYVEGGSGNDVIYGSGGNDTLIAGSGNSTIYGGLGHEDISAGGDGNDLLCSGNGDDTLSADGAGNCTLEGGSGSDILYGSDEAATNIVAGAGTELIYAGDGGTEDAPTLIQGGAGSDTIYGGDGVDQITAGSGTTVIHGGDGEETLIGGSGPTTIYGGDGSDVISVQGGLVVVGGGETTISGGGGATYELDPGFGRVEIAQASDTDTIRFGSGISTDDLTLTATLASDGSPALEIDDDHGGSVIIDGGLDGALGKYSFADSGETLDFAQLLARAQSKPANTSAATGGLAAGFSDGEILTAGSGNDTVVAFGAHCTLIGGTGDDTFIVNSSDDVVEAQPRGFNTVVASVDYIQPENVQQLVLSGKGLMAIGSDQGGTLVGNGEQDELIAGSGVVTMIGGRDDDIFLVNNTADVVEAQNSPWSTVRTSVSYTQPVGAWSLVAVGSDALTLTGSYLFANTGNDTLVAAPGGGAWLNGGPGNDTFVVDSATDVIHVVAGGINTIETSVNWTAPDNVRCLTGTGSANLMLTGNSEANVITANDGDDTLRGGGGNDTLVGGAGLDTFVMLAGSHETVVDGSAQSGVIALDGLQLADLAASRTGNDLLLSGGPGTTLRVKDYFSSAQDWNITDAAGNSASVGTLLTVPAQPLRTVQTLWNEFFAEQQAAVDAQYEAQGYQSLGDGRWMYQHGEVWAETETTSTTLTTYGIGGSVTGVFGSSTDNATVYGGAPSYYEYPVSMQAMVVSSDDSAITAVAPVVSETSSSSANLNIEWDPPTDISSWQSSQGGSSEVNTYPDGSQHEITLWTSTTITTEASEHGTVTGIASGSGGVTGSGLSGVMLGNVTVAATTYQVEQLTLGNADQTVQANGSTFVVGGSGNDVIYDAGYVLAGNGNDTLDGGGTLVAGSGDDLLLRGDDMVAGSGHDRIFTDTGDATIEIDPTTVGTVLVGGAGDSSRFLNAFYESIGIGDWQARYEQPGVYSCEVGDGWTIFDAEEAMAYLSNGGVPLSLEDAVALDYLRYTGDPLPVLAIADGSSIAYAGVYEDLNVPILAFNAQDFQTIDALAAAGRIASHTVTFGAGLVPADLQLSWGQVVASIAGDDYPSAYATLDIGWGGQQHMQVMIPHSDDPIGSGVQQFQFADGTVMSLADLVAKAPPAPNLDPNVMSFTTGMGQVTLATGINRICFADGIAQSDIAIVRDGQDLVLSDTGGDSLRIVGWYVDPNHIPSVDVEFADGAVLDSSTLTSMGLVQDGSAGHETLTGLAGFQNMFIGGPGDVLVSGSENDLFRFNLGAGQDTVIGIEAASGQSWSGGPMIFGPGVTPESVKFTVSGNDLLVSFGGQGDNVLLKDFEANSATGQASQELDFADGGFAMCTNDAQGNIQYQFSDADGSSGTDMFNVDGTSSGTTVNADGTYSTFVNDGQGDVTTNQYAADGTLLSTSTVTSNVLVGNADQTVTATHSGQTLVAGANDTLVGAAGGDTTFVVNQGDGAVVVDGAGTGNTLQFGAGISSDQVTLGIGSLLLRLDGSGDVVHIEGFDPAHAAASGTIQKFVFADGTTLTYDQLLARGFDIYGGSGNDTVTGTNLDNRLHAGTGNEVLIGSGAHDTLYGGAGSDTLIGGAGLDVLIAGTGATELIAGTGGDTLTGGSGQDTFVFNLGAGQNVIVDGLKNPSDVIVFGNGISASDVRVTQQGADLRIDYGNRGDYVLVKNFDPNGDGKLVIGQLRYTDGSYSIYANDGLGDTSFTNYSAAGAKLNDRWTKTDGSHGSDTFNADGSSSGAAYASDGSSSTYTDSGKGDVTTTSFSAVGVKLGDRWTKADGTSGTDSFNPDGSLAAETLSLGAGNHTVTLSDTNITVTGGNGSDAVTLGAGNDVVVLGDGNDTVIGGGAVRVTMGNGNDFVQGGNGPSRLAVGNGKDTLVAGAGVATLIGGTGNDTFVVNNAVDVVQAQAGATNTILTSVSYTASANVQTLTGTGSSAIVLTGNDIADVITANSGNDTLVSGTGSDTMIGGAGNDVFQAFNGADVIQLGSGLSTVTGGNGNITVTGNAGGSAVIGLGDGTDRIDLSTNANANSISLGNGKDVVAVGNGKNAITLGNGVDSVTGGSGTNTVKLGSGQDNVTLGDGNNSVTTADIAGVVDTLQLGNGNNTVQVGNGSDQVTLGNGVDSVTGGNGNDTIRVGSGKDSITLGNGNNAVICGDLAGGGNAIKVGNGANRIGVGQGNNSITLGNGANSVTGGDGTNVVQLGAGSDTVSLGNGNNTIKTGNGNSTIAAGNGADSVTGGSGTNTVKLGAGQDNVTLGDGNNSVTTADIAGVLDAIQLGNGSNTIQTGNGNDKLTVGNGANTVKGGDGADTVTLGSGSNTVTLGNGGNTVKATDQAGSADCITLGNGANSVTLAAGNDVVTTGNGNDVITLGNGNDTVSTGNGNNTVQIGNGRNSVTVGNGTNTLTNGSGVNALHVGTGKDTIYNLGGTDSLYFAPTVTADSLTFSRSGNDLLITEGTTGGSVRVVGGYANPAASIAQFVAGNGNYVVHFDNGSYNFAAGNGTDQIYGGSGNDTVTLGDGNDLIQLGDGTDTVTLGNGSNTVQVGNGRNSVTVGNGTNTVTVGNGNDQIVTGSGTNAIHLGTGQDTLTNLGGTDSVYLNSLVCDWLTFTTNGQDQTLTDVLTGGTVRAVGANSATTGSTQFVEGNGAYVVSLDGGNYRFAAGNGASVVTGGNGADVVTLGTGSNIVSLGNGNDGVSTSDGSSSANAISLGNGNDQVTVGNGWNALTLGNGTDTVRGGNGNNLVQLGFGIDSVTLGNGCNQVVTNDLAGGGDTIQLGDGGNQVSVGQGNDKITLGNGANVLNGGNGANTVTLGTGSNSVTLGDGANTVTACDIAGSVDTIHLGNGNNQVTVGAGSDTIRLGNGNDSVSLGAGHHQLTLGNGTDSIFTNGGSDTLTLGTGQYALSNAGATDSVMLTTGNYNKLWFQQQGNNLLISVLGTKETITVNNWFGSGSAQIAKLTSSDGHNISNTDINKLVQAMAAFSAPTASQTSYTAAEQKALAPVLASSWH